MYAHMHTNIDCHKITCSAVDNMCIHKQECRDVNVCTCIRIHVYIQRVHRETVVKITRYIVDNII